jgi:hypothetical protein
MPELLILEVLAATLVERVHGMRTSDRGEVTEKVIIVAIFAALAIAAGAIIVAKVTAKAQSIPTD